MILWNKICDTQQILERTVYEENLMIADAVTGMRATRVGTNMTCIYTEYKKCIHNLRMNNKIYHLQWRKGDIRNPEQDENYFKKVYCPVYHRQAFLCLELCSACMTASNAQSTQHFCSSDSAICNHRAHKSVFLQWFTPGDVEKMIDELERLIDRLHDIETAKACL